MIHKNDKHECSENESLSWLMDGESKRFESEIVITRVTKDKAHSETWSRYHLIQAALRRDLPKDLTEPCLVKKIEKELEKEPSYRCSEWSLWVGKISAQLKQRCHAVWHFCKK